MLNRRTSVALATNLSLPAYFISTIMKKLTELLQIKITAEMDRYLIVLSEKYKIKRSDFVRNAILEKLKRDVPKLRESKNKVHCPF